MCPAEHLSLKIKSDFCKENFGDYDFTSVEDCLENHIFVEAKEDMITLTEPIKQYTDYI